jgi:hypothetical protein
MAFSPPGTYWPSGATASVADPGGTYSGTDATAPTQDPAGMYSSPYALNTVIFEWDQQTSTVPMIFNSETDVANFYGATSQEANQAKEHFYGKEYAGIGKFITVRVGLGQRCHLIGKNLSADTLAQLQAIQGSVSLVFDGFTYSGNVDLSKITDGGLTGTAATFYEVQEAGHLLQGALNSHPAAAAVTTNDTIVPEKATFWGYTSGAQLIVTQQVSGTIQVGGYVTGKGLGAGTTASQIIAVGRGGDVNHDSFFASDGQTGSATNPVFMTETYGLLTVGDVSSGTVNTGLEVTDAANDVAVNTAIDYNLSGTTGAGSQWVVNNAQAWSAVQATLRAPPITVSENGNGIPINGATEQNDFLSVTSYPAYGFDQDPSSMSYLTGTAADALGLSQATAVSDASPGGQHPTLSDFIDSVVAQLGALGTGFAKFMSTEPRFLTSFNLWVAKHPGYQFLQNGIVPAGSSSPVTDPAGTWSGPGATAPTIDKAGSYSLAGASAPTLAQATSATSPGYYVPLAGQSFETQCDPGYYCPFNGMTHEVLKPVGTFLAPMASTMHISDGRGYENVGEYLSVGHGPGPA